MACEIRQKHGDCDHHQCPHSDLTEHGYECVEIFQHNGHEFCEVGENCIRLCPYSYWPKYDIEKTKAIIEFKELIANADAEDQ